MGGGGGGGVRENERPFTGEGITNLTIPAQNTWEKRGVMKYFTHASIAFWGILQFLSGGKFRASEEQVRFMTVCGFFLFFFFFFFFFFHFYYFYYFYYFSFFFFFSFFLFLLFLFSSSSPPPYP